MINNVAEKFQEAWSVLDISSMAECVSDKVTYFSLPSENSLSGKNPIISYLASKFKYLLENNAFAKIDKPVSSRSEFSVTLNYETLIPITSYAVNNDGIFMVVTLEPGKVSLELSIKLSVKGNKISKIKILEKKFSKCRKTA
jgi:hypothetical protein